MLGTKVFAMAGALLCAGLPAVAAAQSDESAGVVTSVNGDATLIRAVAAARPVSLQMRDEIYMRDRIHTQPHSLVRVLLGGKALVTVRELSVLTVTEESGRVTVDLQSGKVGVAVVKGRMRPGEVIEIRSPNATAAVRGTVFVVEVDPVKTAPSGGAPAATTRVHLFHGALDVSARRDPAQAPVRLAEMQSVVVAGNTLGQVRPISRDAMAALTADLKPKQVQTKDVPDEFNSGLMAREQMRAILLASALLPPVPGVPVQGALKNLKGTVKEVTGTTTETLEGLMDTLGLGGTVVGGVGDTLTGTVGGFGDTLTNTVGGLTNGIRAGGGKSVLPSLPVAGLPIGGGLPLGGGGLPLGGGGLPIGGGGGGLPLGGGGGLPVGGGGGAPLGLPIPPLPLGGLLGN